MSQTQAIEVTDTQIEQAVMQLVIDECIAQSGPVVSLRVGDLAAAMDIMPLDVLDRTAEYARRFWLEGQRFTEVRDAIRFAAVTGDAESIEIEVLKIDQDQFAAALLN